jgi:hypothetical protein
MQADAVTLEDRLAVSCKAKHGLTMWSSNHASWYLLSWVENFGAHLKKQQNYAQMFVAASFIIAEKKKRPRYPSISEWTHHCGTFIKMEHYSSVRN